jgi:hypothetical protein
MGRPSKFKPEYIEQAQSLGMLGATNEQIADFFKVDEGTLYNWQSRHPEFFKAINTARDEWDKQVERALCQKALGFERDGKYYPPDTTACIFWLKNRQSDHWKDVKERHDTVQVEEQVSNIELARRISFLLNEGLAELPTKLN